MKHIKTYKTKSKWRANLDAAGLPIVGYDHYARNDGDKQLDPGVNVLIFGSLMLVGTSRGRSSASFLLRSADEWTAHTTISGAEKMFHAVADGRMSMQMDSWDIWTRYRHNPSMDSCVTTSAPVIRGFWTLAKQGTEFSLIPATADLIP